MTNRSTGPACGNNPNYRMSDGDRRVVEGFKAYLGERTALRDRIAEAIARRDGHDWGPGKDSLPSRVIERYTHLADAVLAVLPPPADRTAAPSAAVHEALRRWAYAAGHNEQGMDAAARRMYELVARDVLRRMADETAPTETQAAAPGRRQTVEYFVQSQQPDGTWESASGFSTDLDFAAARLAARRKKMPDLTLRLAERTTTVAVRALPDCLTCRHWSCDGTSECGALLDAWQRCDCTGPAAGARQDGALPTLRERHRAAWNTLTPEQQATRLAELDDGADAEQEDGVQSSTPPA